MNSSGTNTKYNGSQQNNYLGKNGWKNERLPKLVFEIMLIEKREGEDQKLPV